MILSEAILSEFIFSGPIDDTGAEIYIPVQSIDGVTIRTLSGALIGVVPVGVRETLFAGGKMTFNRIGGCKQATIELTDRPLFQIPLGVVLTVTGLGRNLWAGIVIDVPDDTTKGRGFRIQAEGFAERFSDFPVLGTHATADVTTVMLSILTLNALSDLPIVYNPDKIELSGVSTAGTIENSKDKLKKLLTSLSDMGGLEYGVDADSELYIRRRDSRPVKVLFEGYQVNDLQIVDSLDDVKNIINVKRKIGSTGAGSAGWIIAAPAQDDTSVELYLPRVYNYTMPDTLPTGAAETIADAVLAERAYPSVKANLKSMALTQDTLSMLESRLKIITSFRRYPKRVQEFDSLDGVVASDSSLTVELSSDRATGAKSLYTFFPSGSAGQYVQFPVSMLRGSFDLEFYLKSSITGDVVKIEFYNEADEKVFENGIHIIRSQRFRRIYFPVSVLSDIVYARIVCLVSPVQIRIDTMQETRIRTRHVNVTPDTWTVNLQKRAITLDVEAGEHRDKFSAFLAALEEKSDDMEAITRS